MALKPGDPAVPVPDPNTPASPTFDQKAFRDELLGEFTKALGGATQSLKKDVAKMIADAAKPAAGADPANPNPDPPADPANPNPAEPPKDAKTVAELNAKFQSMERKFLSMEQKAVQAEKNETEERNKRLEGERLVAIETVLGELPFPTPKAKQQFRDAYQSKIKRDEDGSFIVETDKGPLGFDVFLKTEFEDSPHMQQAAGHGGAGANAGKKPAGGSKILDVMNMTTAQIIEADKKGLIGPTLSAAFDSYTHPS